MKNVSQYFPNYDIDVNFFFFFLDIKIVFFTFTAECVSQNVSRSGQAECGGLGMYRRRIGEAGGGVC